MPIPCRDLDVETDASTEGRHLTAGTKKAADPAARDLVFLFEQRSISGAHTAAAHQSAVTVLTTTARPRPPLQHLLGHGLEPLWDVPPIAWRVGKL
eukprot:scaffold8736_cov114-Isochrysis_galbana.AAC.7